MASQVSNCVGGASGKAMHGRSAGHGARLLRPDVELADEQQAGPAVFQHEAHDVRGFGREDRHRGAARHPDRQFGHEEVSAVLGEDGDPRAGLEALAAQVAGHAGCLAHHVVPGVVDHLAAADGLRQINLCWVGGPVVEHAIEDQLALVHGGESFFFDTVRALPAAGQRGCPMAARLCAASRPARFCHWAGAPAWNHCAISARSASVMPVALFMGISRVTTTCW